MRLLTGRLRLLPVLLRSGRLVWRLLRDSRTPLSSKLIVVGTLLYVLSPFDLIPDVIPVLGELDDAAALALGLDLFLRSVPAWLRAEHETALGRTREGARIVDL